MARNDDTRAHARSINAAYVLLIGTRVTKPVTPDGQFHPIPINLTHEPFRRIWEDNVFRLLLDAGRIDHTVVSQIRSWRHSGFSVDRSVRLPAGDRDGLERLAQYMARVVRFPQYAVPATYGY